MDNGGIIGKDNNSIYNFKSGIWHIGETISLEPTLNGSSSNRAALKSTDIKLYNPSATTGWYWINLDGTPRQYWVNMDFEGGGWVLVGTHAVNVSIPNTLTLEQVAFSKNVYGNSGFTSGVTNPISSSYSTFVGLEAWALITYANNTGNNFIYYTATSAVDLNGTHSRRTRWKWNGWKDNYAWNNVNTLVNDVGGVTPGLYTYSIANNYSFSAYDADRDAYSGNCSTYYNNAPWWYGSCWDGSFWGANGGAGHANAAFWTGSGTDYYAFGAMYVK